MWPFSSAYPEVRIGDILDEYDYIIIGKYTTAFIESLRLTFVYRWRDSRMRTCQPFKPISRY